MSNKGLDGKPRGYLHPRDDIVRGRRGRYDIRKKSVHFDRVLEFWSQQTVQLLMLSQAHIVLIAGRKAYQWFVSELSRGTFDADQIFFPSASVDRPLRSEARSTVAWFVYTRIKGVRTLTRIILYTHHWEHCSRSSSNTPTSNTNTLLKCFRERLIDLANVYVGEAPIRPAFLSSCKYFKAGPTSVLLHVFVQGDDNVIHTYLQQHPRHAPSVFANFLKAQPELADSTESLMKMFKSVVVPHFSSKSAEFWRSRKAKEAFGSMAVFYLIMAIRQRDRDTYSKRQSDKEARDVAARKKTIRPADDMTISDAFAGPSKDRKRGTDDKAK